MSVSGPKSNTASAGNKPAGVRIDLPTAKQDRAMTGKVGVVAVAGFLVGMAWPRLLGIQVGPDVPGNAPVGRTPAGSSSAAKSGAALGSAQAPASAESAEVASDIGATDETGPSNKQQLVIGDGQIIACKNKKNDKLAECGKLAFDKLAKPRLAELSRCRAAVGLDGTMAIAVNVNFDKDELMVVEGEKKKGDLEVPSSTVRGVLACAGAELKGLELDKLGHTHPRYTINYRLTFYPPGSAPPSETDKSAEPASDTENAGLGRATVTWEKALLRESPKDGKVKVRVPSGTRVKILEQKDDWYLVESTKGKGWVYRQAIGK